MAKRTQNEAAHNAKSKIPRMMTGSVDDDDSDSDGQVTRRLTRSEVRKREAEKAAAMLAAKSDLRNEHHLQNKKHTSSSMVGMMDHNRKDKLRGAQLKASNGKDMGDNETEFAQKKIVKKLPLKGVCFLDVKTGQLSAESHDNVNELRLTSALLQRTEEINGKFSEEGMYLAERRSSFKNKMARSKFMMVPNYPDQPHDELDDSSPSASPSCSDSEQSDDEKKLVKGQKMVAHLKHFDSVGLSAESFKMLPDNVKNWIELSKCKFDGLIMKGDTIPNVTLFLATAFIEKSSLLKYNDTNLGRNGCLRVKITEKILAILICVLAKYKFDNFTYADLLQCEKLFRDWTHPGMEIWKVAKEEMQWMQRSGDLHFLQKGSVYDGSKSEVLFAEVFNRFPTLELDAQILLICIKEDNIKN